MNNTILLCNQTLNFDLKTIMNDTDDLVANFQSLKQLQFKIDQMQIMKDDLQLQLDTVALGLLRKYILSESIIGLKLVRNLIRKFYPLNDEQIVKYEILPDMKSSCYCITNINVLRRKGNSFSLGGKDYLVQLEQWKQEAQSLNFFRGISGRTLDDIYQINPYIDFHDDPNIKCRYAVHCHFRSSIMKNKFTIWDWELVQDIRSGFGCSVNEVTLADLLNNEGFIAQMGIENIETTIAQLKELEECEIQDPIVNSVRRNGKKGIRESVANEAILRYKKMGYRLYSYLPITKEFILMHQDELDWDVMKDNPRIEWDLELINLFLRKYRKGKNEVKLQNELNGTRAMYEAIAGLLNDEVLSDVEKLYPI